MLLALHLQVSLRLLVAFHSLLSSKDIILFKRAKYLSTNKATLIDIAKHLIKKLQIKENIFLLQPTFPLRRDIDIIKGTKIIEKEQRQ